ncbi:MAG: phosphatidate cytidylyltransferase [Bacteroidales bacterium]|nr:phosphatidate cytidylyltransferase [Bacteroidales bacterium]
MNNFLVRTLSSVVFLAVMVAGILLHPAAFGVLFLVIMYLSLREFLTVTMGQRWLLQQKIALFTVALEYLLVLGVRFYGLDIRWLAAGLVPLLAIAVSVVMTPNHDTVEDTGLIYLGMMYTGIPFMLAPVLVSGGGEFRGFVLLNVFIIIWLSDTGAYCIGTLFGQKPTSRKLAPAISPKKSWWGFWGGIVLAVAAAYVLHLVGWMTYPLVHCLVLGALISAAGVCGDLFESVWKRRFGVKDSGNCIPGHGGMLDRFDSSLLAIPTAYTYLTLFGLLA